MKNKIKGTLISVGAGAAIAGIIFLMFILLPLIGWITGHIVKLVFGNMIANGLNLLFNTVRFAKSDIPTLCATLALIGSFFKNTISMNKQK